MLMIGGTLTNYIKTLELTQKAQQRIYNPEAVQEKEDSGNTTNTMLEHLKQLEQDQKAARIGAITTKLRTGMELSDQEMDVLRKENPPLYQEAMKVVYERRAYEKRLGQCKTKDEVQRVNLQRMQAFASEAKGIHQSTIPQGAKHQQMEYLGMRMAAIRNEHTKFVNSKRYAKLPTEEELQRKKKEKSEGTAGEQRRRAMKIALQQRDPELQKMLDRLERETREASKELSAAEADEQRAKTEDAKAEDAKRGDAHAVGASAENGTGRAGNAPESAVPGAQWPSVSPAPAVAGAAPPAPAAPVTAGVPEAYAPTAPAPAPAAPAPAAPAPPPPAPPPPAPAPAAPAPAAPAPPPPAPAPAAPAPPPPAPAPAAPAPAPRLSAKA